MNHCILPALKSWSDQKTFHDAICSCGKVATQDTYVCNASGKVTVTLEDVLHIFGLPIDGEVVTGWTDSSHDFLVTHCLAIFDNEPKVRSSSKSYINISWVCHIRDTQPLDT
ncbi:Putative oligosaccharide biosynthesis protein [Arachis hypogaea]|nr:Putative oligosaccharide biosynthesis protein [Arachis hypogaea]